MVVMSGVSVPSAGTTAVVTFSRSVTGVSAADYHFEINGRRIAVASVSGSGTSRTFALTSPRYFATDEALRVEYVGTSTIDDLSDPLPKSAKTVTNSSSVSAYQKQLVEWPIGGFIHYSESTFLNIQVSQGNEDLNVFYPTALNIDQWITTAKAMKARYLCLTVKHSGGFSINVSAVNARNISAYSWYPAHGNTDIVAEFVTKVRAAGLGVGLYYCVGDYWWENFRPGHDGTYGGTAYGLTFTQYTLALLTELLTNYGPIDFIWTDGWGYLSGLGYGVLPYATVKNAITALQPNCLLIENGHEGASLAHTDIATYESISEPLSSNTLPSQMVETSLIDEKWFWNVGLETYKDPQGIADRAARMKTARSSYMINLTPNSIGVIPENGVAFANAVGALLPDPDPEYPKLVGVVSS